MVFGHEDTRGLTTLTSEKSEFPKESSFQKLNRVDVKSSVVIFS